ncbi:hypothetical protein L5515_007368 [Caenorhabditis briggsae]|uniref:Headcase N-terminal domain-containing protein n=1 Tax=Caenorhabditis briggsae TaxID=6238 RepID=A0AAE9EYC8_CAEBR|nr:hypothetical protein L5515_007368 [Caenorhabditis briggsae]
MPRGLRRNEIVKRGRNTSSADGGGSNSSCGSAPVVGCPVLDPIRCQCPKEDVDPLDGVKMTCTWESCPYSSRPLHSVCYQLLEDNLVRRLATLGSARGWTVPQRRNNLWERKGQSLVGKFCRCRCNRGQMTRDKQALYEKEKAVEKEKKKKAKKAKQLPVLQFNSKPSAALEEKKRGGDTAGYNSPSAASSHHHYTFSPATRSRLHTDRSTSTMLTYTVGRTWSESSFGGEPNNNDDHPSDCDCVFHYDYDADEDDHEHDHIDTDLNVLEMENPQASIIVPAPPPPPLSRSYAATIKDQKLLQEKKQSTSPDSGIGQPVGRLSFSDSSNDEEHAHRVGDYEHRPSERNDSMEEGFSPLGLTILSPVEVSSSEEIVEAPKLTETPHLPKKREPLRATKSNSVSKLPLATPQLDSDEPRCGFSFKAPVREMMDIWHEATASTSKCSDEEKTETVDMSWTPFFGRGFNLGERLYYMP